MAIQWQWKTFAELSVHELYAIMKVRQEVFVIEQNCVYQDVDNLDQTAWHMMAWDINSHKEPQLLAYCRVILPGYKYKELAIGRVLTINQVRRTGLGRELMTKTLSQIASKYPEQLIRISAQLHLEKFYESFDFKQVSEPYDEEGIAHIEMLKTFKKKKISENH